MGATQLALGSCLRCRTSPSSNSAPQRGTDWKYFREGKLATEKDGKRVRGERGEEVQHCVFATPAPPELAVQPSGSESMNISPLPKQKCIIRTDESERERFSGQKWQKCEVSQASQARRIGTELAPSLSQPALEFSSAWGEKGRSFTLSSWALRALASCNSEG